ncbi:MAG TPA: HDOD domain-containing protein [Steroidobacteraceae bacterium]|nr:HDOD domain-containing protein [Steroidobacteraceae bacterium]
MPAAWLGLLIIAAVAVVVWLLGRRSRRAADAAEPAPVSGVARAATSQRPTPPPSAATPARDASPRPARTTVSSVAGALSAAEVFHKFHEFAFAASPLAAPAPAAYEALASQARSVLETVATEPRFAPRRPLLLPQLLRAIRDDDVSRRDLAKLIAQDPALAGSLLRLANSSFYRASERPVESVDRAVALLGTDGIRSLVAAALVQPVFQLSKQQFPHFPEAVWEHTYRAAGAAEAHAAIVEDADPFAAQLLGLTMGLGSIVVFRVALDRYAARPGSKPDASVIAMLLDEQAATVARRIALSWELSERIADALRDQGPGRDVREERTPLGRSLHFGRLIGALAVLYTNERVNEDTAKASMLASGATAFEFERIWTRLTGKAERAPERQKP